MRRYNVDDMCDMMGSAGRDVDYHDVAEAHDEMDDGEWNAWCKEWADRLRRDAPSGELSATETACLQTENY
jgi:hypothetical protein